MRVLGSVCAATLGISLVTVACVDRSSAPSAIPPGSVSQLVGSGICPYAFPDGGSSEAEEELFGDVDSSLGLLGFAALTRRSDGQPGAPSVPLNYGKECDTGLNGDGPGHANEGAEYGWYSPSDPQNHCDDPERHREQEDLQFPESQEAHCADDGEYVLVLGASARTTRPVDFIWYTNASAVPADSLEASDRTTTANINGGTAHHRDVIVNYADTPGTAIVPQVQISPKPVALLQSNKWRSQPVVNGEVHVPQNYLLRVNSWGTSGAVYKQTLVRYFWNYGVDNAESGRTGFVNVSLGVGEGSSHVRSHQYATAGVYRLVAHFLQPGDLPASGYDPLDINTGTADTVMIRVHGPLEASASVAPAGALFAGVPLTFTASGGNGGGNVKYIWNFGDGSAIDSTSGAIVTHEYQSPDTMTLALVKRDQHGYAQGITMQIAVVEKLEVSAVANNSELSNEVKQNQTCQWLAQPYNGVTYTWQRFMGVWKPAGSGNPLSVWTGSQSGTRPYRLIGTTATQADTFNFNIKVTSGGAVCSGW